MTRELFTIVCVIGAVATAKGDFSFQPYVDYKPWGGTPQSVALADMNNDGLMDIVLAHDTFSSVSVLTQNPDHTFTVVRGGQYAMKSEGEYPRWIHAVDFDKDGKQDVIVANWISDNVTVRLGDGKGGFAKVKLFACGRRPMGGMTVGDFNKDGNPDVATANSEDSTISVLLNDGKGSLLPQKTFKVGRGPQDIQVADFDGDGNQDLVVSGDGLQENPSWFLGMFKKGPGITVLYGDGQGDFKESEDLPVKTLAMNVAVADVNGDGRPDVIAASPPFLKHNPSFSKADDGTLTIYAYAGNRKFSRSKEISVAGGPYSIQLADFDNDGALELATLLSGSQIAIFKNKNGGEFGLFQILQVGQRPENFALGDLNGDKLPDIVTANWGSHTISVILSKSNVPSTP